MYHEKTFGPLDEFGYSRILERFMALNFDAAEWTQVTQDGGTKFTGNCLVHHDGYCLWDSKSTRWDSMNTGPKRDIYGELAKEIDKRYMHLLLAMFHHALSRGFAFDQN